MTLSPIPYFKENKRGEGVTSAAQLIDNMKDFAFF